MTELELLLNNWYAQSSVPLVSAFALGLLMSISPCPLSANIMVISYLAKNLENKSTILVNGLLFIVGRAFAYVAIALVFYLGWAGTGFQTTLQQYGEKILGPLFVLAGLVMLGIIKIPWVANTSFVQKLSTKNSHAIHYLVIGVLLGLAFCPYSGVLFFGLLIPATLQAGTQGVVMPFVFALGSSLPIIFMAVIIVYSVKNVGIFFKKIQRFELVFRKIMAAIIVATGLYLSYVSWF